MDDGGTRIWYNYRAGSVRRATLAGGRAFRTLVLVHVLTTAFLAYHPEADAQSVGSAVSPLLPSDATELVGAKPKRDYAYTAIGLRIVLPQADVASMQAGGTAGGNQPLQIGFHRAMPDEYQGDLSALMEWTPLADGSIASAVSVTSPEALAVRAGIRAELGPGGEIRFFGGGSSSKDGAQGRARQVLPVMTRTDFQEDGELEIVWSPIVEGDTIGIEVTLPSREALSAFSFSIEKISHIYGPMGPSGDGSKELKELECANHILIAYEPHVLVQA